MSALSETERNDWRAIYHGVSAQVVTAFARLFRVPRGGLGPFDRQTLAIRAGAAAVAFVLIALLFDTPAILGARTLPHWLAELFNFLTDFGKSGWFLWPLGLLMIAIAMTPAWVPNAARRVLGAVAARAGFLFLAIGLPGLFGTIVKRLIGRARPFVGGEADPWLYHPFGWKVEYASLPSGHAVTAFAAAVAIGMLWPRMRAVMWIYAIIIAISRVVLTAHHPSDVFAGAVVGIAGVVLVRNHFAARRLVFGVSAAGRIIVFPGPSLRRLKSVARALLAD
ncbi:MAG: phosphatase PAP2 family protein [Pseudolabrys sp.]|nr:phosphatase PAP2 family protein [Pseudolabrys sp.]